MFIMSPSSPRILTRAIVVAFALALAAPSIGSLTQARPRDTVLERKAYEKLSHDLQRVVFGRERWKQGATIPVIVQGDLPDGDAARLAGVVGEEGGYGRGTWVTH